MRLCCLVPKTKITMQHFIKCRHWSAILYSWNNTVFKINRPNKPNKNKEDIFLPVRPESGHTWWVVWAPLPYWVPRSWRDSSQTEPSGTSSWRDSSQTEPSGTSSWRDSSQTESYGTRSWSDSSQTEPPCRYQQLERQFPDRTVRYQQLE